MHVCRISEICSVHRNYLGLGLG